MTLFLCACVFVCQVAGRLHVQVWRGTEGSEEDCSGQSDPQRDVTHTDQQERKLDCVVRTCKCSFIHLFMVWFSYKWAESKNCIVRTTHLLSLTYEPGSDMQWLFSITECNVTFASREIVQINKGSGRQSDCCCVSIVSFFSSLYCEMSPV